MIILPCGGYGRLLTNSQQGKDPRRSWPIVEWLTSFRLDMSSNAAFKESSKIQLLQQCVQAAGWHFQNDKPLLEDFLEHLDHPYKGEPLE
jgi:proteasome activator subunit 4